MPLPKPPLPKSVNVQDIYHRVLVPNLVQLGAEQRAVRTKLFLLYGIVAVAVGAVVVKVPDWTVHAGLLTFALMAFAGRFISKPFRTRYKSQVVKRLFDSLFERCEMAPERFISQRDFAHSDLFSGFNRYGGEDFVSGVFRGLPVEFSELDVRQVTGSGKNRSERVVFKGVFFQLNAPKDFGCTVLIQPDVAESMLGRTVGRFLQSANFGSYELVQLESPEFEKIYVVRSDSQQKARMLLTPAVMQRMTDFKRKYHHDVGISFKGPRIRIAVSIHKNLFDPRIFGTLLNKRDFEEIKELVDLLDELLVSVRAL